MEIEHIIRVFPIDENLQTSVDNLVKEGWEAPPGIAPVAVYHLVRLKKSAETPKPPAASGFGDLQIDDSKIMVIPAGQKTQ